MEEHNFICVDSRVGLIMVLLSLEAVTCSCVTQEQKPIQYVGLKDHTCKTLRVINARAPGELSTWQCSLVRTSISRRQASTIDMGVYFGKVRAMDGKCSFHEDEACSFIPSIGRSCGSCGTTSDRGPGRAL
jgi:hypothetical protein